MTKLQSKLIFNLFNSRRNAGTTATKAIKKFTKWDDLEYVATDIFNSYFSWKAKTLS